jgi:hypothetical protein
VTVRESEEGEGKCEGKYKQPKMMSDEVVKGEERVKSGGIAELDNKVQHYMTLRRWEGEIG